MLWDWLRDSLFKVGGFVSISGWKERDVGKKEKRKKKKKKEKKKTPVVFHLFLFSNSSLLLCATFNGRKSCVGIFLQMRSQTRM